MVLFTPFGIEGGGAADRVDALVWALSDLFPRMVKPIRMWLGMTMRAAARGVGKPKYIQISYRLQQFSLKLASLHKVLR